MGSFSTAGAEAASPRKSATGDLIDTLARLARLGTGNGPGRGQAAEKLRQLVAAVHATTGLTKHDARFPQDRAAAAFRDDFERASAHAALREVVELPCEGRGFTPLDAGWLSYGLEAVLRDYLPGVPAAGDLAAARALGLLARAAEEAEALWLAAPDGGASPAPPHLLSAVARGGQAPDGALRLAWSSRLGPTRDEVTLRRHLAEPKTVGRLRTQLARWARDARALPMGRRGGVLVEALVGRLLQRGERALAASWLWRWVPGGWDAPRAGADLERTVRLASAALLSDGRLREVWEVQRWGGWCEEPRIARFYPVGLCLLALAQAGADVSTAAAELLSSEASADGFRYYGRWRGIPPDSDDLGLALRLLPLAGDTPERRRALAHPVGLLLRNTRPDGWLPLWLEEGLLEPPEPGPYWTLRRCSGVVANVLTGLLETDWPLPPRWRNRALGRLVEVLQEEGLSSAQAFPACYTRLLLVRLGRALEGRPCPERTRAGLAALLEDLERELLATQRLDGGWGSPLATASHLAALSLRRTPGFDPTAAIVYLCARQEHDGLWPAEVLYDCPGRDNVPQVYSSRGVTSAICLEALALARRLLPPGARPSRRGSRTRAQRAQQ